MTRHTVTQSHLPLQQCMMILRWTVDAAMTVAWMACALQGCYAAGCQLPVDIVHCLRIDGCYITYHLLLLHLWFLACRPTLPDTFAHTVVAPRSTAMVTLRQASSTATVASGSAGTTCC